MYAALLVTLAALIRTMLAGLGIAGWEERDCTPEGSMELTQDILQLGRRVQANEGVYVLVNDRRERRMQRSQPQNRPVKGAIAQLGEHLLCKQGVGGSIPPGSTKIRSQATGYKRFVPSCL